MGILLLAIVAGLVVSALGDLDEATLAFDRLWDGGHICQLNDGSIESQVCWLGPQLWDLSTTLPQRQFPGMLLRSLFGYAERMYWVQAIAYGVYWGIVGGLYARTLTPEPPTTERQTESAIGRPKDSQV